MIRHINVQRVLFLLVILSSGELELVNCDVMTEVIRCYQLGELYAQVDSKCYFPLTQGPCNTDQWIVLDRTSRSGVCQTKKCPDPEQVLLGGACRSLFDPSVCSELGKRLFYNALGTGVCACEEGWLEQGNRCYQEFTEGWCSEGKVVRRTKAVEREVNCTTRRNNESCVFPFQFNGSFYSRCTREGDSENRAWCSTSGGRGREEGWGYCKQECLDEEVHPKDEDDEVDPTDKLVCSDNICGDPKNSLAWTDGKCHGVEGDLSDCVVGVGVNNKLICRNNSINQTPISEPLLSLRSVSFKPSKKKCKRGHIWSRRKGRCIRNYFG